MFIASGSERLFSAPEERHVAETNPRSKHFAPLELLTLSVFPIY
jgi:hypothetical protein